mmetsp:Transcript_20650/g.65059  ORF Transcript_20650/g.65059 Transcript_20650/m.65059 type:complete len:260 (-) Transcript_20650:2-781(-)
MAPGATTAAAGMAFGTPLPLITPSLGPLVPVGATVLPVDARRFCRGRVVGFAAAALEAAATFAASRADFKAATSLSSSITRLCQRLRTSASSSLSFRCTRERSSSCLRCVVSSSKRKRSSSARSRRFSTSSSQSSSVDPVEATGAANTGGAVAGDGGVACAARIREGVAAEAVMGVTMECRGRRIGSLSLGQLQWAPSDAASCTTSTMSRPCMPSGSALAGTPICHRQAMETPHPAGACAGDGRGSEAAGGQARGWGRA